MAGVSLCLAVSVLCTAACVGGVWGQQTGIRLETECVKSDPSGGTVAHCRSPSRYDVAVAADPRELPHMAMIGYGDKNSISWNCGGSLITDRVVLSAAHCAYPSPSQTAKWIRLGATVSNSDSQRTAEYEILERILHPEYKPPSLYNDIALFVTKVPVKLSEYIRPICLHTTYNITSKFLISSGWLRHMREGKHKAKVGITRMQDCKEAFKPGDTQGRVGQGINSASMFCASKPVVERENEMLAGDSVHVQTSEAPCVYRLAGVLSFGRRWGPEVYSRVSHFLPWIQTTLSDFKVPPNDGKDTEKAPAPRHESCRLPDHPHIMYKRRDCGGASCSLAPSHLVDHGQLVTVTCAKDYHLVHIPSNSFIIECADSVWLGAGVFGCSKKCPPLTSLTLHLTCKQGLEEVNCKEPALPDTVVEYKCKAYHDGNFGNLVAGARCQEDGTWSKVLPQCTPKCGISRLHTGTIEPQIIDGKATQPGNFPWHAGLYQIREEKWTVVCGGTLISNKAVLSAAHCVTDMDYIKQSPPLSVDKVRVGLGKNLRDWDAPEDAAIKLQVIKIHIPQNYVGIALNFEQDIAVLILEEVVEVNAFVMPACLDFSNSFTQYITGDEGGFVAGWGSTEECGFNSNICTAAKTETLMYTRVPIIDFQKCFNLIQGIKDSPVGKLSSDKLCSANVTTSVVQQGDSGGGLTFLFGGKHYIFGVVSVKLKQPGYFNFAAFTNVQSYLPWVRKLLY